MSLLLTIALLAGAPLSSGPLPLSFHQDEAPPPEDDASAAQVLVIGTLHAPWIFRSARYTPAHLRALIAAYDPDVVAVQAPPEWLESRRYLPGPYEIPAIVLPDALLRGAPVHGIDTVDLERWEVAERARTRRHAALLTRALEGGTIPPLLFGEVPPDRMEAAGAYFERPEYDFRLLNEGDGTDDDEVRRGALNTPAGNSGGRNQQLAARCLEVIAEHPGAKLLVLVGSGHKAVLDVLLAQSPDVRVLELGTELEAPTREQVEAAWTAEDLTAALGHNLDGERSYFHPELIDLDRMRALVERLAGEPGYEAISAYFQARIDYALGDPARALERLEALEQPEDGPALYPYPMGQWRMRYRFDQALRLERARALAALERTDEARTLLLELYEELPTPPAFNAGAPADGPALDAIADAGFESAELATRPAPGAWFSEEVVAGRQSAARDTDQFLEGEASLRLDILEARPIGRASLIQELLVDDAMRAAGDLRFDVRCRTEGLGDIMLAALTRAPETGQLIHLGRAGARLRPADWNQATLRFTVPEDAGTIELHLTYDALPEAQLWLDDARLTDDSAPPFADWGAAILAREFPRTLLEEL